MSNSKGNVGIIAQEVSDVLPDIITISANDSLTTSTISTIDLTGYGACPTMASTDYISVDTITISGLDSSIFSWHTTPFEDSFPDWNDFQEMCKEYPGLEKAYEHMKVFYKLCKDEWEAKKKGES